MVQLSAGMGASVGAPAYERHRPEKTLLTQPIKYRQILPKQLEGSPRKKRPTKHWLTTPRAFSTVPHIYSVTNQLAE